MKVLQMVLVTLIRQGKVTVEVPDLDMDRLHEALKIDARETLREIKGIVCEEEMTSEEKVAWIQERLEWE